MDCSSLQLYSASALHSLQDTERRIRRSSTSRKLSTIPEELPVQCLGQTNKRSTTRSTSSNLDTLVASVFGAFKWDEGQDEVDLEILYRIQRPDLKLQTESANKPSAPVFGLVEWARQAAFDAQDMMIEQSMQELDPQQPSPIDRDTYKDRQDAREAELNDELEALMVEVVKKVSITAIPAGSAQIRQLPAFKLPLRVKTHTLHSPMMTPINSPLNSVSCF